MLAEAYLGLGSNLGDRSHNIGEAVRLLREISADVKVSSLYVSSPVGFTGQPAFLNAACRIWTRLGPFELLEELERIEAALGSQRAFANAPRTLDIDILVHGRGVYDTPSVSIPHPRMAQRGFVLVPLAEIAPYLVHPVLKETVRSLLLHLPAADVQSVRRPTLT